MVTFLANGNLAFVKEEVAETITKLGKAGITTWMVTGDKKETAVNLGYASGN